MKRNSIELPNDWFLQPEWQSLSPNAKVLHLALLAHSNRNGCNGVVTLRAVQIEAAHLGLSNLEATVSELLQRKRWSYGEVIAGEQESIALLGWENHMKSAEELSALSSKRRRAGKASARSRVGKRSVREMSREEIDALVKGAK